MEQHANKLPAETEFLTGVVEGFYGRPWTYPQRKELFRRMNHMGMNTYLYAPKDDVKHRQSWRDLYTIEEEQQLQSLITEATDAGILFIFALSPGLDVTFSSSKELEILKKKIDQVSKLGCRAFALLFDDIELRLRPADREVFSSCARAQVVFANDIYNYLGCPDVFLFCPTEYCASLAIPSITKSDYLSTVASYLAPGIAVIWTGPLVVSKNIQASDVQELSKLLQHPIVLWDNLHANDYDQRRVFIGPYSGRPLALRRDGLLRGVLTNPNCEFEANYVALHTLAQWSRYGQLQGTKQCVIKDINEPVTEITRTTESTLECLTNGTVISDTVVNLDPNSAKSASDSIYQPREALLIALRDWLALMLQDQQVSHPIGCKSAPLGSTPIPMDTDAMEPAPSVESDMAMEAGPTQGPCSNIPTANTSCSDVSVFVDLTLEDLELFADLFYLPFAHGPAAMRLLELGHWIRDNSYVCGPNPADSEKNQEWVKHLAEFIEMVSCIARLRDRIQRLPSRSIAYELAPYITEVHAVLGMVVDYFRWLETGVMAYRSMCHLRRLLTWFSPGYRDIFTSGDQEPWTFRGGLITEIQRIIPLESAQDLFPAPSRAFPTMTTIPNLGWSDVTQNVTIPPSTSFISSHPSTVSTIPRSMRSHAYVVRAYQPSDKSSVYALFRRLLLARVGLPENALPPELADLPGDRYLLHFLEHSPENCLVVEGPSFLSGPMSPTGGEEVRCVAFGLAAVNAVALARDRTARYKDILRSKYPISPSSTVDITQTAPVLDGSHRMSIPDVPVTDPKCSDASPRFIQPTTDECASVSSVRPLMTPEEFIKFLIHPFHADTSEVADIADVAAVLPPPEPLGAALPTEPALSGCLDPSDLDASGNRAFSSVPTNVSIGVPPSSFPMECPPPVVPPSVFPASLLPDTAPPSPPSVVEPPPPPVIPSESCSSSPAVSLAGPPRPAIVAGGSEALHTALTAHPATLLVEFDDSDIVSSTGCPTPAMLMNHNLGLSTDPPEVVWDSVARRLFICLLASLKTVGAHGTHVQLDVLNEHRNEMYRRFGFYPVPAASTEQITVLARLI